MSDNKTAPDTELGDTDLADFDDAAAGQGAPPAEKPAEAQDDKPAEMADAPKDGADQPADAKPDAPMIPKGRFDEALRERDSERAARAAEKARADALAAELEALKKGPPINYAEEIKALDAAWNSDGEDAFDGTHADYLAKRDALLVGQAKEQARAEFQEEMAELTKAQYMASWEKASTTFVDSHEMYADKNGPDFLYFNAALKNEFASNPEGTFQEWLDAAHEMAVEKAIKAGRAQPESVVKDPNAARNAADAKAQAVASSAPSPAGSSDRGRASFPGIGDGMDEKDYKALPKDVRESKDLASF